VVDSPLELVVIFYSFVFAQENQSFDQGLFPINISMYGLLLPTNYADKFQKVRVCYTLSPRKKEQSVCEVEHYNNLLKEKCQTEKYVRLVQKTSSRERITNRYSKILSVFLDKYLRKYYTEINLMFFQRKPFILVVSSSY